MSSITISGPTGGAHNRLDIRTFIRNEKFFSLYIQALQAMQKEKETDPSSYFQLAGIHALPYTAWDGVQGDSESGGGYCNHGTVLFPTWHRPYILLFEQIMQGHAKKFAEKYRDDQEAWKKAAEEIRQPYWDWAACAIPPDEVIALDRVVILTPNGRKEVDNPLHHYSFESPHFQGTEFHKYRCTHRYPVIGTKTVYDDIDRLRDVFETEQEGITTDTFKMLTRVKSWDAFSNHTSNGFHKSLSNSLEAIHDNIHGKVGGDGQMSHVTVAGFDPIFWLHHCNVDRMLSLWSALNPGVWVTTGKSGKNGTRFIPPNTEINGNTRLGPFRKDKDTFWTSAGVSDTTELGYSYPEFDGLDLKKKEDATAIAERIKTLYGNPDFEGLWSTTDSQFVHHTAHSEGGFHEWTVRIECKQFELPVSYTVLILLGVNGTREDISTNPADWPVSPYYVGSHSAFVNTAIQSCGNCGDKAGADIEGFVDITTAITRRPVLRDGKKSLEPEDVVPFLTKNLHWRVLKLNGEPATLSSLEVTVYSTLLTKVDGATFPKAHKPVRYDKITRGRPGGSIHRPGEEELEMSS